MFTAPANNTHVSTTLNLRGLLILRSVGIVGQSLVIGVAIKWFEIPLPLSPLAIVLIALAAWNALTLWRVHHPKPVQDWEFFVQLLVDVMGLTGVLYFSGGATNPFAWFFLLPLTIAATVLPKTWVWTMAGITTACYSLLMLHYIPLHPAEISYAGGFKLHVFGMWFGFVLSAGLVAYFISGMANTLRERDRILAQAREQALRDERLIALGTLATGAAHELGTPLGTIAIVTGELEREYPAEKDRDLNEGLGIIRDQITRCKHALSVISASAGELRTESGKPVPVEDYLKQLVAEWRSQRPGINLQHHLQGKQPSPRILAENILNQALTNILNNAADASPECVELNAQWNTDELVIEINDCGPGLSAAASAAAGKDLFSTKKQGLGLGLFLAHASIERLGGDITLFNREESGVCTRIVLPLSGLATKTPT
ncbi:MAG: HAMP domain-containing histidine kinase [Gammaproteobacteria bacterium]|nr:HAMP domain-containing histidine kinase [Gammaproteobacteria bacterium]